MNQRISRQEQMEERLAQLGRPTSRTLDPLDRLGLNFQVDSSYRLLESWSQHAKKERTRSKPSHNVLYVHLPFCARLCSYCLLSARRPESKNAIETYVEALLDQIQASLPVVKPLKFSALHMGGGTPTLLSASQLGRLLGALEGFSRTKDFQIGIEAHPSSCSEAKVAVCAAHGVDRVSFGVETFSPEVLKAIERSDQTRDRVHTAVGLVQKAGLRVNIDLLAGLPGETLASWTQSVQETLELNPDSLSVNRFLLENAPLTAAGYQAKASRMAHNNQLLLRADSLIHASARSPLWPRERLQQGGFGTQYVWDESNKARAYFQQDMIGPSSTLALGQGGMGHIEGAFYYIASGSPGSYAHAQLSAGDPEILFCPVDDRFEQAFYVSEQAVRGQLSPTAFHEQFGIRLGEIFGDELGFLVQNGLLQATKKNFSKPVNLEFQTTDLLEFLLEDPRRPGPGIKGIKGIKQGQGLEQEAKQQYLGLGLEIPPSLFWCRLSIRASRSARQPVDPTD